MLSLIPRNPMSLGALTFPSHPGGVLRCCSPFPKKWHLARPTCPPDGHDGSCAKYSFSCTTPCIQPYCFPASLPHTYPAKYPPHSLPPSCASQEVVPARLKAMEAAVQSKSFPDFARLTCTDSNQFHATCLDTAPPIFYLNDTSRR